MPYNPVPIYFTQFILIDWRLLESSFIEKKSLSEKWKISSSRPWLVSILSFSSKWKPKVALIYDFKVVEKTFHKAANLFKREYFFSQL